MRALRLIQGENRRRESTGALRLDERSRRPGLAHEELTLELDRELAARVTAQAASDGVPAPLWAVIAIESERARLATVTGHPQEELSRRLDWIARRHREPPRETRLAAYAAALRRASDPTDLGALRPPLALLVPYHSLVAWEIAAEDAGAPLEEWARNQLGVAGRGRSLWEAAAAEAGQMLAEWVAVHAARAMAQD